MIIGWYVHHHGAGHQQRFLAVRPLLPGRVVALSSLPMPAQLAPADWQQLPPDFPARTGDPTAGGVLHWAPTHHPGLRARMAALAQFIDTARPDALVVDVSVEIALYARLMGIPVIWIGQRGTRTDAPHRTVYSLADVIVPWTHAVRGATPGLPADTRYTGAFSRLDNRTVTPRPDEQRVLLMTGRGGDSLTAAQIHAAQAATPDWHWTQPRQPDDADALWQDLMRCDVVVGSAGTNVVAEVAAARRPYVCLPQPRPFDEQLDQAHALHQAALAEAHAQWPPSDQWPAILARALTRDPARWQLLHDSHGAQRLADHIAESACASR